MRNCIILFIVACLVTAPLVAQMTWYVDDGAVAPGTGMASSPFATITQATLASADGDTILVGPGTYRENIPAVPHRLHYMSFMGPQMTIVEGQYENQAPVFTFFGHATDGSELIGFTITGGRGKPLQTIPPMRVGGGVLVVESDMGIRNCIFQANEVASDAGPGLGGGIGWIGDGPEVVSCWLRGNYAEYGGGAGGAFTGRSMAEFHSVMMEHNEAKNGGAVALLGTNAGLQNCTMADNLSQVGGGVYYDTSLVPTVPASPQSIVNTIIRDNVPDEIHDLTASMILVHCDVSGGWPGSGFGNMDIVPAFCDQPGRDYRLIRGSPCIDQGIGAPSSPYDFECDSRSAGAAVDIGADEWTGDFLLDCAAGTVPGAVAGTYDVFRINGSAGGIDRRVDVAVGSPLTFSVEPPPFNVVPAPFILWGVLRIPGPADVTTVGNFGEMCFSPFDPATLTVASSLVGLYHAKTSAPQLRPASSWLHAKPAWIHATPAPWHHVQTYSMPMPLTVTIQGIIVEGTSTLRVTNGVLLEVR